MGPGGATVAEMGEIGRPTVEEGRLHGMENGGRHQNLDTSGTEVLVDEMRDNRE